MPDTKDWTWTLTRRCDDCGLTAAEIPPADFARRAEVVAAEWSVILTSSPAVTRRPLPDVWSPVEYGAHVRDVYRLFEERLRLMLTGDAPVFDNWDQDEAAIAEDYAAGDPDQVASELVDAASAMVGRLRALQPGQLDRVGFRSDGTEFTVQALVRYFLHDVIHHLADVTGQQDGTASLEIE